MYADDACVIAPSPSAMYELLNTCSIFAEENSVIFNSSKTKFMCFKPKSLSTLHVPDMYLNGQVLTYVSKIKYLGVFIDCDAGDNEDILRHVRSTYARGNMLISKFKICTDDVKYCLFRAYMSTAYGCQLWTCYKKTVFRKAAVAYNNVYRKLFNLKRGTSISATFVNNNVDTFNVL